MVLDLPEPWQVVKHAEAALRPGGILVAYTPSITQVSQLREALAESRFKLAETVEVLNRTWHVEGQAVRPDHRMVAHSGFITVARKVEALLETRTGATLSSDPDEAGDGEPMNRDNESEEDGEVQP